tara:strand:- start:4401 stop:5588 length:1188 start_codon:yes stop_codon:yes gene_type:complete
MKILFYYFSTCAGGQQLQILNLAKNFKSFGHDIIWIYEEKGDVLNEFHNFGQSIKIPSEKFLINTNIYIIRAIGIILSNIYKYFFLKKFFKKNKIDLVLSSDSLMSYIIGKSIKKYKRNHCRLVGADLEQYEPFFKFYKFLEVDKYIDFYFGFPLVYNSLLKKNVSSKKFTNFQHNAVDTEKFFPLANDINMQTKKKLDIKKEEFTIGWVGRLDHYYGSRHLLSIGKNLLENGINNFKIIYVGGGFIVNEEEDMSYVNFLKKRAKNYGLSNQTLFLGWVNPEKVLKYYNVMDFVPMLEKDPTGGSILREAMACGRVAISVDGPSKAQRAFMNPENSILVNHKNFVYNASKQIMLNYKNKEYQKKIGINARKFCIENLSFKKQAQDIMYYVDDKKI